MPHSDYTTEVCQTCRRSRGTGIECQDITHENEPINCPYRMAREGRTLPPVPVSTRECTEWYPNVDDVPQGLCKRCGLNRGDNATCCHDQPDPKPKETINKTCSTCGHNYGEDGKVKYCNQSCHYGRLEGWIPYIINEPTPVVVTASRFYTPTVMDEMKEIKPVVGWEE